MAPPPPTRPPRLFDAVRAGDIEVVGSRSATWVDLYYFLVAGSWARLLAVFGLTYLLLNALFALGYLEVGGVEGARPGSFADAFFFSVETFATIGFGAMHPSGTGAHLLVTLEAMSGLLAQALATGLIFAKFSRPRARVLFSRVAVIGLREGLPTLMFRVANERRNHVVEAQMRVAVLRNERTREGEQVRRVIDVPLVRQQSPAFVLTWTALHTITPDSPFHGVTPARLEAEGYELVATLTGTDEALGQVIFARYGWGPEDIRFDARFADILLALPDGRRRVDYRRFHDTEPAPRATS